MLCRLQAAAFRGVVVQFEPEPIGSPNDKMQRISVQEQGGKTPVLYSAVYALLYLYTGASFLRNPCILILSLPARAVLAIRKAGRDFLLRPASLHSGSGNDRCQ